MKKKGREIENHVGGYVDIFQREDNRDYSDYISDDQELQVQMKSFQSYHSFESI